MKAIIKRKRERERERERETKERERMKYVLDLVLAFHNDTNYVFVMQLGL